MKSLLSIRLQTPRLVLVFMRRRLHFGAGKRMRRESRATWSSAAAKLRKVYAHTMPGNARSERLLESFGFLQKGVLRDEVKAKGRWRTLKRWAVLRDSSCCVPGRNTS